MNKLLLKVVKPLASRGMREGMKRGLGGGSSAWTVVGAASVIGWLATRALPRKPEVVFLQKVEPGDKVRVLHEPVDPDEA